MTAALLILVTVAAYLPAMKAGLTWRDDANLTENPLLRSAGGLTRIWSDAHATAAFQPLTYTVFWLEHQVFDNSPLGYHVLSLALHLANVLLLWTLLRRLALPLAWLAAGLFAIHPIQADTVAWISQTGLLLSTFGYLLALLGFLAGQDILTEVPEAVPGEPGTLLRLWLPDSTRLFYTFSLATLAAALACHPVAATWPLAAGAILWWKQASLSRRDVLALAPFIVLAVAGGLAALFWSGGAGNPGWAHARITAAELGILTMGPALGLSVIKTLLPFPAVIHFEVDPGSMPRLWAWPSLILIAAGAARFWMHRRSVSRGLFAAVVLFLTSAVLVAALDGPDANVDGRMHYLFAIVPTALIALAVDRLCSGIAAPTFRTHCFTATTCGVLAASLVSLTLLATPRYTDAKNYWTRQTSNIAGEALAQRHLGDLALARNNSALAIYHYEAALCLRPTDVDATLGLARTFLLQKCYYKARAFGERVVKLNPGASSLDFLAEINLFDGDLREAVENWNRALQFDPSDEIAHTQLGFMAARSGKAAKAEYHFVQATRHHPKSSLAHVNLGTFLVTESRLNEAAEQFVNAANLDSKCYEAFNNAGVLLVKCGQAAQAEPYLRYALTLRPESPEACSNLASALALQGRTYEASFLYKAALRGNPTHAAAERNLDVILESPRFSRSMN